jgi:hypothetical protein
MNSICNIEILPIFFVYEPLQIHHNAEFDFTT